MLKASFNGGVSAATGERAFFINLQNVSGQACTLDGYPSVQLRTTTALIPFKVQDGGQYVLQSPHVVTLQPEDYAHFLVSKYRCDLGPSGIGVQQVVFSLPGSASHIAVAIPTSNGEPRLEYCSGYQGSPEPGPDPGNAVGIGPFVAGQAGLPPTGA